LEYQVSIFEKLTERISERIKDPALGELVKEQSLKDLLTKREFHLSQGYLQREFLSNALDDEIVEFSITLCEGYGEIAGKMKKRLLPALPFSATFSIHGVEFSAARKCVLLKLEKVGPIDIDWLTRKVVQQIPFLSCSGDLITCDLTRIPRLRELFAYRIKGLDIWSLITLKELSLKDGEIVGRVGVVL
jgi:hypothetical protein